MQLSCAWKQFMILYVNRSFVKRGYSLVNYYFGDNFERDEMERVTRIELATRREGS